jgi:tripartite-type tricarboxylate transporter receptor subunit TctC
MTRVLSSRREHYRANRHNPRCTSFEWISNIIAVPFFVVVPANSEFRSLADIIAKAKAAPGTVTYGSAGPGSTHQLGIELLSSRTGAKFMHVPYRGDAPVVTALLASEVQFALATPTLTLQNVRAGKLRALAVASNTRATALPDLPTAEQAAGMAYYDVRTWFAMAGPASLPKPVVDRLNAELRKTVAVPEVRARLAGIGGEPAAGSSQEMRERVARELAVWTKTVNDAGFPKE